MSSETEVKNWPYNENNLYSNTKRYCKERMGVSVVTNSNESINLHIDQYLTWIQL